MKAGEKRTSWTPERIDKLTALHGKGFSRSQIAAEMNRAFPGADYSRSAIGAKLDRLGISLGDGARAETNRLKNAQNARGRATKNPEMRPKLAVFGNGAVMEKAEGHAPRLPAVSNAAWAPLPGSTPVLVEHRKAFTCRWPIDLEGCDVPHLCGEPAADDRYCGHHAKRSRSAIQPAAKPADLARQLRRWAA